MKVLVSAASKYGATTEIAEAIGNVLVNSGLDVDVRTPDEVTSIDAYQVLVLGSAVYAGHWLTPARDLVDRYTGTLQDKSVWLFSSGPVGGDPPMPKDETVDISRMMAATDAVEHKLFAGRLQKRRLNFADRAIAFALGVPEGDYRDWGEIASWASRIAELATR